VPHRLRHTALCAGTLGVALLLLCGCQPAVLSPRGAVGSAEKNILIDSLAIMLAIVVPTIAATLGFAWWFRASNKRAKYDPTWTYSGRIELIVWGVPLLTIMLLGGVAWIGSHELDPGEPLASDTPPLDIQGVSLDWKWLFVYPAQHVAAVNELVVPAGVPLRFALTSGSVMNAFFIPRLGSMIYTMNGMTSRLNLIADRPGLYRGISSHYSGDGFSDMHFTVRAVPAADFTAWVTSTRGRGPVLDAGSYASLSRQSMKVAPFTYRDVEPALFARIISQEIPPAPGPHTGRPTVDVSHRTEQ
jgi:cytochrome o ubiquinol oxidase subunit 2